VASPLKVEFQFDFGSPEMPIWRNFAIPALKKRTGVKFEYVPVLLGGVYKADQQHCRPSESLRGDQETSPNIRRLETPALYFARHNITKFKPNPFLFRSTNADADAWRRGGPVSRICSSPYFPQPPLSPHVGLSRRRMDDLEIFRNAFHFNPASTSTGTDGPRAQQETMSRKKLIENTTDAVNSRGLWLADILRWSGNVLWQGSTA